MHQELTNEVDTDANAKHCNRQCSRRDNEMGHIADNKNGMAICNVSKNNAQPQAARIPKNEKEMKAKRACEMKTKSKSTQEHHIT